MDLWFYIFLILFGIGGGACAFSSNRTIAIAGGTWTALVAFQFFSTPFMSEYFVQNAQDIFTNEDIGWVGICGIGGGIIVLNWKDNPWTDSIGIAMILAGALLLAASGFGDSIITNYHELLPTPTRPVLIEAP